MYVLYYTGICECVRKASVALFDVLCNATDCIIAVLYRISLSLSLSFVLRVGGERRAGGRRVTFGGPGVINLVEAAIATSSLTNPANHAHALPPHVHTHLSYTYFTAVIRFECMHQPVIIYVYIFIIL